jgi:hypothetical protein
MAEVLTNLVAGHYNVTYGGAALGATEDGWTMTITSKGDIVTADEWGEHELDIIGRGVTITLEAVIKEWTTALVTAIWQYHATFGRHGCIGYSAIKNSFVQPMVFTPACAGGTADATTVGLGSATTFPYCLLTPDSASKINLNNRQRVVPVQFSVLLHHNAGAYTHFTQA